MKQLIICLAVLLCSSMVFAQDYVREDFTHELCMCLIYHADHQYNLGAITDREDLITYVMDTCYPIHFLQVRTYAPNNEIAADMMGEEEVENAYEDLATEAVEFVMKENQ